MKINISYYASLREKAQKTEETIETDITSLFELYEVLKKKYKFPLNMSHLRVAVNDEFKNLDYQIKDSDSITFIPPVAGG